MENQVYLFGIFILNGLLIGLIFDFFRILRKCFKTKNWVTYIQDISFWIITGLIILYSIFKFNNGELRGYIFIGILLGISLYILIFSKTFIKVNLLIINFIKKVLNFIIIKPIKIFIKFTKKFLVKPISFIIINISKNLSDLKIKFKKLNNKNKKCSYKKDLM